MQEIWREKRNEDKDDKESESVGTRERPTCMPKTDGFSSSPK